MRMYVPRYYKNFKCIAEKCTHSCCIGWEIDVDERTLANYSSQNDGYFLNIKESIEKDSQGEPPHFRLSENGRCPHLTDRGLCKIIINLGEENLCDICREHPRFYFDTKRGREAGVGMACEEAARLILESDDYSVASHEEPGACDVNSSGAELQDEKFDAFIERERLYSILSDKTKPYPKRLSEIYRTYNASPALFSDTEWREIINDLDFLSEAHKVDFLKYSSEIDRTNEPCDLLERAFAYFYTGTRLHVKR